MEELAPLRPKLATLEVSSRPGGAQIYLDDESKGTASAGAGLVLKGLPPRSYRLRLSLPGHQDWMQTLTLAAGETRNVAAELVPAGPPPFTVQDVVDMLRGDVAPPRVAKLVEQRGVDFAVNDAVEKQIRDAGGDAELLFAIAKARK